MLFYPSLFPPPQRDKVKECCISTSNSIQVCCHSVSFQAPLSYVASLMPFPSPNLRSQVGEILRRICLRPAFFAWRTMASLISLHVNPLFYPNLFAEEQKRRRCKPTIPAFQFVIFLSPEWGEENRGGMQQPLVVLTPKQVPLHSPSSRRSPNPTPPPRLLLRPISAEQWSVKKFPISKFTHCINLV